MPTEDRVGVILQITSPASVHITFPTEGEADSYWESIKDQKSPVRIGPRSVQCVLPSSVREVESSRSCKGFVLWFGTPEEAASWTDPICKSVPDHAKCVVIQQYWDGDELKAALSSAGKEDYRRVAPSAVGTKPPGPHQGPAVSKTSARPWNLVLEPHGPAGPKVKESRRSRVRRFVHDARR